MEKYSNLFDSPQSEPLFYKDNNQFTIYQKNNIVDILDKLNKIGYTRNCKNINNNDINLCSKLLNLKYTSPYDYNKPDLLDYYQKMTLQRLINKHSKYAYNKQSFNKLCKLIEWYNHNNKEGSKKIHFNFQGNNPNSYILGKQIGFLLNENNKKIYRLDNNNNILSIQKIVDLRDIKNIPCLDKMDNIPLTNFNRLDDLQKNNIDIGDEVVIQTNSNEKQKCMYFDSIANCINYCKMYKRV